MRRFSASILFLLLALPLGAANLLDDPSFELATSGTTTSNSAWELVANMPDGVGLSAQFQDAPWASNPEGVDGVGVWFKAFEGEQADGDDVANAGFDQVVVGGSGFYDLTFYAKKEANFTAGAMFVAIQTDMGDQVLFSLLDASVPNDGDFYQYGIFDFFASPGTTEITVGALMLVGVDADVNPQSLFLDDFSLTQQAPSVPEPSTWLLTAAGLAFLVLRRRR